MSKPSSASNRMLRINQQIKRELAWFILERNDPLYQFATLSSVVTSRDLSHAKVYVLCPEPQAVIIAALNEEAPRFRRLLAKTMRLRIVPVVRFYYDESKARSDRIAELINNLPDE